MNSKNHLFWLVEIINNLEDGSNSNDPIFVIKEIFRRFCVLLFLNMINQTHL